ncbi:uncharacterized protein LOC134684843 [Mytilus trossulus]|uniref:uncharacterized protein LOC134684843 n=1 Tax=Mytilus trossulus TaxID=6551 RepID=UPI003005FD7D
MATSTSVCAVCDHQHQTIQSTHWCIECEEPLCTGCKEHHNVLKATRNHKTIFISDYQLLPSAVTDVNQYCIYHNEIYQLYCNKHESPICNKCVKDHGKCGEILSLDELVKDIKTSESFVDLEHSLDDIFTNINLIRKDRESNIENITDQKKKIAAQVCYLKMQINQHVEKLEKEFTKELDQIEFDCCNQMHSIVSSLQDKAKEINQIKSEIKSTKKYASNLQAFLRMMDIQSKTTELEKHLQFCIQNEYHEKIIIESETNTKIYDFLTVERLGSIKVKKIPSTKIDLIRRKDRQAQIMVPKAIKSINDVKLELLRKFDTNCNLTTGCCVTNKGEFLFTNYEANNEKVNAINADGEVVYAIPLTDPYSAFDVVSYDGSTLAVSTGCSLTQPGIVFVDLIKRKIKKFIDLPDSPFGITYDGKSLICCVADKNLHVISCTDYSITTIPITASSCYSYVSTYDDKIFYTNPHKHTVTCRSYSRELVWEFKDKSVLDRPLGLTVDNNGNVFVVGELSCNIIVISPDGKQCKQILTKKDGLKRTTAIFFDKVRNQLLVTIGTDFANVYDISYG